MSFWGTYLAPILMSCRVMLNIVVGYKFETISLIPDTWAATPRDTIENRENEIVNNHAQYCSIVKTGIGKAKMIIGGEVDAGMSSEIIILPLPIL